MSRNLIAILRGVRPGEAVRIASAVLDARMDKIEVPLNSPDPFDSIAARVAAFGDRAQIGAGTVLSIEQVKKLAGIGARLVVSPNCNINVICETRANDMHSFPGVLSPSECFAALKAGADDLKVFPASTWGPSGVSAVWSVLPKGVPIYAVGGVNADDLSGWIRAVVAGFGIGSSLYKAGNGVEDVAVAATSIVKSYDNAIAGQEAWQVRNPK